MFEDQLRIRKWLLERIEIIKLGIRSLQVGYGKSIRLSFGFVKSVAGKIIPIKINVRGVKQKGEFYGR